MERELDKLYKIEQYIERGNRLCMYSNCSNQAINSHLLQRNGVLNYVAEEGHLYEPRKKDIYKWENNDELIELKKIGIKQAISFPLFCSEHDCSVFKPIEKKLIDFDDYQSQLLFSYRSLCSEIRKKEFNIERFAILPESDDKFNLLLGTKLGLEDLKHYKKLFEEEINKPQNNFTFLHLSYAFIPFYASGSSTYFQLNDTVVDCTEGIRNGEIADCFFINIIPQRDSLEIIVGYNNDHTNNKLKRYVNSWKNLHRSQLFNKIIDLFNVSLESWGMAPSLYKRLFNARYIL